MSRHDRFWNPRTKTPTSAQVRLAGGLAVGDPRWTGPERPLSAGARPHPLFSNLTESEIDMALALMGEPRK